MDTHAKHSFFFTFLAVCMGTFFLSSIVNADQLSNNDLYSWKVVPNSILSETRGGFVFSNGVEMDIGLRRNLSISGLGVGSADRLLQNTTGTSISIPLSSTNTIIRNSLDNMTLKNTTIIDVRLKNFDLFKNPTALTPQFQTLLEPTVYQ